MQKTGMSARGAVLDLWGEDAFDAKRQAYKRELPHARAVDRCINLVRKWGRSEPEWDTAPEAAPRDFVTDWFEIARPERRARVVELIDQQAQKWWTPDRQKLKQLRQWRDEMKASPELIPPLYTMGRGGKREGAAARSIRLAAAITKLIEKKNQTACLENLNASHQQTRRNRPRNQDGRDGDDSW